MTHKIPYNSLMNTQNELTVNEQDGLWSLMYGNKLLALSDTPIENPDNYLARWSARRKAVNQYLNDVLTTRPTINQKTGSITEYSYHFGDGLVLEVWVREAHLLNNIIPYSIVCYHNGSPVPLTNVRGGQLLLNEIALVISKGFDEVLRGK